MGNRNHIRQCVDDLYLYFIVFQWFAELFTFIIVYVWY